MDDTENDMTAMTNGRMSTPDSKGGLARRAVVLADVDEWHESPLDDGGDVRELLNLAGKARSNE